MPPCSVSSHVVAVAPDARESARSRRRGTSRRRGRSRSRPASTGTARCRRARPSRRRTGLPVVVEHLDGHARARGTGSRRARPAASGCRATKQDTMSVPPEIDDRQHVLLDALVDVVEALRRPAASRSRASCAARRGRASRAARAPTFCSASMYLADVPKMRHALRRRRSRTGHRPSRDERRAVVEHSVAPGARPETSQFHIIQPQVVK